MKLCIIGNSHTGALKRAWDNLIEPCFKNNLEISFFASRGHGLKGLYLNGTSLVADNEALKKNLEFTSNGHYDIKINNYDFFLIYGLFAPYYTSDKFYSVDVIEHSLRDHFCSAFGYTLLTMVRSATDKKIYADPRPLPANPNGNEDNFSPTLSSHYSEGIRLANDKIFLPLNSELIHQPPETLVGNNRHTHSKFSKGSKRLDEWNSEKSAPHPTEDLRHMNDQFGKIWLESFFKRLSRE